MAITTGPLHGEYAKGTFAGAITFSDANAKTIVSKKTLHKMRKKEIYNITRKCLNIAQETWKDLTEEEKQLWAQWEDQTVWIAKEKKWKTNRRGYDKYISQFVVGCTKGTFILRIPTEIY